MLKDTLHCGCPTFCFIAQLTADHHGLCVSPGPVTNSPPGIGQTDVEGSLTSCGPSNKRHFQVSAHWTERGGKGGKRGVEIISVAKKCWHLKILIMSHMSHDLEWGHVTHPHRLLSAWRWRQHTWCSYHADDPHVLTVGAPVEPGW